jgi:transposase InsO family protein
MNIHKRARLSFARRVEMARGIVEQGLSCAAAAAENGVCEDTARKWRDRYIAEGEAGLRDRSSRPHHSPKAISEQTAGQIIEMRHSRYVMADIAKQAGCSQTTVSRVCARAQVSRLSDLEPKAPVQRYEYPSPGGLLHIDTKKLGRIRGMGHRVTGDKSKSSRGAGWEFLFVAVDDHARIGVTQLHLSDSSLTAIAFLAHCVEHFQRLGVTIRRLLTDNGSAFRSKAFRRACVSLGIKQIFTRPYTPRTNGKAERFIQSALREWAYGFAYNDSAERAAMLERWIHHYNWHRPHHGIGRVAPMQRLGGSPDNLLQTHS